MTQRTYNFIYNKLVNDKDDVLGIIAYSLYKRNKIDFINKFKAEHGTPPGDDQMLTFHASSTTESSLEGFRRQAVELARAFLDSALDEERQELEQEYAEKYYLSKVTDEVKALKPNYFFSFLFGVSQGLVSSVLFAALIGFFAFVFWSSKVGIPKLIGDIFGYEVIEKAPVKQASPRPGRN
jgi:hypothetical protein